MITNINLERLYCNADNVDGRTDALYLAVSELIDEVNELREKVEALEQKT